MKKYYLFSLMFLCLFLGCGEDDDIDVGFIKIFSRFFLDYGKSVQQTTDGGYIITGNTYSYGNQSEIILLKIDREGKVQDFSE